MSENPRFIWLPALFGALLGLGLARFAYTPLLPALVGQGWLSEPEAAFAGAANLLGYLVGALGAQALAGRKERIAILNGAMLAAAISLLACAWPLGFYWMTPWRFIAGVAGGFMIVLGPATIFAVTPPGSRARVSGLIFMGVGLGIVLSGTFMPLLAGLGLSVAWICLGLAGFALTAAAWRRWPRGGVAAAAAPAPGVGRGVTLVFVFAYAMDGAGFVPHTLFLSDFVARALGQGEVVGGFYWAIFGVGAATGAPVCGLIASRFGLRETFVAGLTVKGIAIALPLVSTNVVSLTLSAFVVGALTPALAALAAGVSTTLAQGAAQARLFGAMTIAFALAQATAGYAMSWLFATSQDHMILFAIGSGLLLTGALAAGTAVFRMGRG
ncbi:MAG: MFS transporter [Microvirga sp.]|nr:MFS transporter [Microvirga sp.]